MCKLLPAFAQPQLVAESFIKTYYLILERSPDQMFRFYKEESSMTIDHGEPVNGGESVQVSEIIILLLCWRATDRVNTQQAALTYVSNNCCVSTGDPVCHHGQHRRGSRHTAHSAECAIVHQPLPDLARQRHLGAEGMLCVYNMEACSHSCPALSPHS